VSEFRGSFFKEPKKAKPKWRKPIKVKSERRYSENEYRAAIRQQVFDRDGGCLLASEDAGECAGPDTPHHLLKASAGGPYTLDNLVTLCARHNTWVEDNPEHARRLGMVRRGWEAS
jgi:5-methylcytosine-specific restriction endonuclease McrA